MKMKWMIGFGLLLAAVGATAIMIPRLQVPEAPVQKTIYDFKLKDIEGKEKSLKDFKGKVLVVVNTASKCGLTPQYEALQALYTKHKGKVVVLGMPANDFAGQEPGTNAEIQTFCTTKYNVTFPMFSKITVVGDKMDPLYAWLINKTDKKPIEWNFAKFIVGKDGQSVTRFASRVSPADPKFVEAIDEYLAMQPGS